MSNENTPPEENSQQFTDLLAGLAKRPDGSMVAERYRIEKHLGGGGMGDVYLVKDTELKDEYRALKLIKGQFVSNETDLKRFQNEVRLTSRLDHPNIVRVFEYGVDGGELYYTMQYVKGKSLRELLDDHDNKLPLDRALTILTELAKALEHAHAQKVIHRDLKPENIIIPDDGSPIKLTDFGLARSVEDDEERLTKLDSALGGTANYMSPEQAAESTDIDHRSDIYSFGILAYELATGKVPFEGLPGIVKHHHRESPIPSAKKQNRKLPGWFASIIEACTKKDREERYQSFEEIARVLGKQSYSFHWRSRRNSFLLVFLSVFMGVAHLIFFVKVPNFHFIGVIADHIDEASTNTFFRLRGALPPSDDVVVVAINEDTFDAVGIPLTAPIPRRTIAELLQAINIYAPNAIYLDFMISKNNNDLVSNKLLADAINGTPTYLAKMRKYRHSKGLDRDPWILPDSLFGNNAQGYFIASKPLSVSGNLRNYSPFDPLRDSDEYLNELLYYLEVDRFQAPTERDLINFYGPPNTLKTIPAHYFFMKDYVSRDEIHNKYVVIGLDLQAPAAVMQSDTHRTVFSQRFPGVEAHATKISNLLNAEWIGRLDWKFDLYFNFLIAGLLTFAILSSTAGRALIITSISIITLISINYIAFLNNNFYSGIGLVFILCLSCSISLAMSLATKLKKGLVTN